MSRPLPRLLLLLGLALAVPAAATTVVHMDTRALARRSSDIVVGEVTGLRAYWNEAHTRILTDVSVRVSESLKGAPASDLTLTQLGGELDGLRYDIPGGPSFAKGEEALLFVWRDAAGRPQVNGLAQGKFEIGRDAASGARLVQRSMPGLGIGDARTLRAARPGEAPARVTLDTFKAEIRRALAEEGVR